MKKLGKLPDGRELLGFDLKEISVKALSDFELEITGSTSAIDRDGESLDVNGWDLKNFKKNPVVLPAHQYSQPAIGKATKVKVEDGKLNFKIQFPEEGVNPLSDIYRKLYKGGYMNASSIGFIPKEWIDGSGEKEPRRKYLKQELLEISLVSVPSNYEALTLERGITTAKEKGIISDEDLELIRKSLEGVSDDEQLPKQDDPKPAPAEAVGEEEAEKTEEEKIAERKKWFKSYIADNWIDFKEFVATAIEELKDEGLYKGMLFGESEKTELHLEKQDLISAIKEVVRESKR